jgi:hypothetical protein
LARGQLHWATEAEPEASDSISDAMALLGIYCEDETIVDDDEFWLWPENEDAFWLWVSIQTQWVVGMTGRTGLNYSGIEAGMRMQGIRKNQQQRLFGLIQTMESAALQEWASER